MAQNGHQSIVAESTAQAGGAENLIAGENVFLSLSVCDHKFECRCKEKKKGSIMTSMEITSRVDIKHQVTFQFIFRMSMPRDQFAIIGPTNDFEQSCIRTKRPQATNYSRPTLFDGTGVSYGMPMISTHLLFCSHTHVLSPAVL
jgi:hypothetical protein